MVHFVVSVDNFDSEDRGYPLNLRALTTLVQRIGTHTSAHTRCAPPTHVSFLRQTPSKKPKPTAARAGSGAASSDGFQTVGEVFPGRICPDDECPPPKQLLVRYKNGRPFVVCSNNVRDDPTSCQLPVHSCQFTELARGCLLYTSPSPRDS